MGKPFVEIGGGLWRRGSNGWKWAKTHLVRRKAKPTPIPAPPKPTPPHPLPAPAATIAMFDSVTPGAIPAYAPAVAGYVGGHWPNYTTLVKQHPKAHHLSIAVFASEDADCLDVERGDAAPAQAAAWIRRQHKRGIKRKPVVYTSASLMQPLVNLLSKAGLKYGVDYQMWSAHYNFHAHLCGPHCGMGIKVTAHATQWTDKALGRNLDESLCSGVFFGR
jgi:hypothetical protein